MTKGIQLDDETAAELQRLRALEKKHRVLQQEHELTQQPEAARRPARVRFIRIQRNGTRQNTGPISLP